VATKGLIYAELIEHLFGKTPLQKQITERGRQGQWQTTDLSLFAAMNADPEVMRCILATLAAAESARITQRMQDGIAQRD